MFGLTIRRATLSLRTKSILLVATLILLFVNTAIGGGIEKFNPATTELDLFRVAVRHSERLRVPEEGAGMVLLMKNRKTGRVLNKTEIFLQKIRAEANPTSQVPEKRGEIISVYRIPERKVEELRALQSEFLAMPEAERKRISGSLSIDVTGCKVDAADNGPMLISTFMNASELGGYVLLAEDYDLRNVPARDGRTNGDPIRPCSQ